jgi:hypothetical protein
MTPGQETTGAAQAMRSFLIATPENSLRLTSEQAENLYDQLREHLRGGSHKKKKQKKKEKHP